MTHRDVAISTLAEVIARLKRPEALGDLERKHMALSCEYAMDAVGAIQELRRARRKTKGAP